jgi:mRNA interferase MazF
MKEGDVVLTPIPQADGKVKNRPAILLREMPLYGDMLVCGISTQLHHYVQAFDEIISLSDADFASSGLVSASLIRLSFLTVLPRKSIVGAIGSIAPERHKRLLQALCSYLIGKLKDQPNE